MNLNELAKKHQHDHTGFELVDWFDAAVPAYQLSLRASILEKEILHPVEQFVLRALQAGNSTCKGISRVLGLEKQTVTRSVERLDRHGCVLIAHPAKGNRIDEVITISVKGHQVLADLVLQVPKEDNFIIFLDATTGEYFLTSQRLRGKWELRDCDDHQIPLRIPSPTLAEIRIPEVKARWREDQIAYRGGGPISNLLDILELEKSSIGYRTLRILQFVRPSDGEILLQAYDQSDRSLSHEVAFLQMEKEGLHTLRGEKKPIELAVQLPDPVERIIPQNVYEAAKKRAELQAEVSRTEETIARLRGSSEGSHPELQEKISKAEADRVEMQAKLERLGTEAPLVDVLPMAEHRPLLLSAIRDAKQRLIIVSPWLTPKAVNRELRDLIATALKRNVKVSIGYGFGEANDDERETLRYLYDIQKGEGGGNLSLHRIGDSHAKVVICDDSFMVTTSFNWLSFAGRQDWGARVEFGTLVRDTKVIQTMFEHLQPLFNYKLPKLYQTTGAAPKKNLPSQIEVPNQLYPVELKSGQIKPSSDYSTQLILKLDSSVAIECMYIPAGDFWMGSSTDDLEADSKEKPPQHLFLPSYWIGRYPVTVAQYSVFINEKGQKNLSSLKKLQPDIPIHGVTWDDALDFCKWMNRKLRDGMEIFVGKSISPLPANLVIRLPTEAEWEKASRGDDRRKYPWGNQFSTKLLNFEENGGSQPTPVGRFSPQGDSPYGCADMAGNVWEWVNSLHRYYPYCSDDGRENILPRENRILRGGSYHNRRKLIRCAARVFTHPSKNDNDFGFRLVVSTQTADQTLKKRKENKA